MNKTPGDDTGMQTRVWGPAGWIFLHSIAQNYPWEPTAEKKESYKLFFSLIGDILPCRYCRESYKHFIIEKGTCLNDSVLESRKTLTNWLYKIHNKVNKKLGYKNTPTEQKVWDTYESYRSKCTKSPEVLEKIEKGCLDPMKGFRKKCIFKIVNAEPNFGKSKVKVKLLNIKRSTKKDKKLMATFETNGRKKVIHFGAKGMSDYTKHHDRARRQRYIARHRKDLRTNNPIRAGYLSMFILWNKPNLSSSIRNYRKRLNVYNRTGKFPVKI